MRKFEKSFTRQEPVPESGIERAVEIMRSGKLHRYNTEPGEESEASALEREYAAWQGCRFCLATTSGGTALQMALRAAGVAPGDKILANAWTLAPVPGAMHSVGGDVVLVEIDDDLRIDIEDLARKAETSGAKILMLSHMRGHIGDMERIVAICERHGITLIEDCAHTMGARWNGTLSGNFGRIACFSAQTYKHINSGEGGMMTTDDPEIAARAIILSGSYMLYERHGAIPDKQYFEAVKLDMPNCSSRLDNLRAALLRAQLPRLEANIQRWNQRYQILEEGLSGIPGIDIIERPQQEFYVGSSIQFRIQRETSEILAFVDAAAERGIDLKWFGADEPKAFTSRFDSWAYLNNSDPLPKTRRALSNLLDMRVPLTFNEDDCRQITEIIAMI